MLKYSKTILTKVSFDARLFEKELRKALRVLVRDEIIELKKWCFEQFGEVYAVLISRCFKQVAV